jgi:hypothetical protein
MLVWHSQAHLSTCVPGRCCGRDEVFLRPGSRVLQVEGIEGPCQGGAGCAGMPPCAL